MTATAVNVNTTCKITNNSGTAVVILDAYDSATNTANKSPATGYEQNLKALPLAGGGTTLANGASDAVTLNDTRQSKGQTLPNYLYQLLISKAQGLFPVMDVSEALDFTSMGYPPVTVTAAAAANMTKAFAFMQNLMAYPGSNLATGFVSAMTAAQAKTTPTEMMQVIADYFNTTKSFQGLDFPSYLSVSSHMKAFAWTWGLDASGNPGRTYNLYAQSDVGTSEPSTQGTVTFSGGTVTDPTDANSGYTITLQPSTGGSSALSYNRAQFVNDTSVDVPSICLQGSYALKSTFTQKSSDNVLWPIILGTVNGIKVIGVSQAPEDAFVAWLKNLMPKSFNDLVNSFLKIMGIVMAIDFLKTKLAGKEQALKDDQTNENDGQPPNDQQQQQADSDSDSEASEELELERGNASRFDLEDDDSVVVPDEDELSDSMSESNEALSDALDQAEGDELQGALDEFDSQIKSVAEIGVNDDLEDAMGKLVDANEAMPDARDSGDFSDVSSSLPEIKSSVNASVEELGSEISEELHEQIAESQSAADAYEEAAENIGEQGDAVDGGDEEFDPEVPEV